MEPLAIARTSFVDRIRNRGQAHTSSGLSGGKLPNHQETESRKRKLEHDSIIVRNVRKCQNQQGQNYSWSFHLPGVSGGHPEVDLPTCTKNATVPGAGSQEIHDLWNLEEEEEQDQEEETEEIEEFYTDEENVWEQEEMPESDPEEEEEYEEEAEEIEEFNAEVQDIWEEEEVLDSEPEEEEEEEQDDIDDTDDDRNYADEYGFDYDNYSDSGYSDYN